MLSALKIPLLTFCILLTCCERIETGEAFTAHVGDKFKIRSNLSFSVDSINDYRCPAQYMCIWGGDVKMICTFHKSFSRVDTAIYLNDRTKNPVILGGYSIRLLSVDPQSQTGERIPQKDYKLEIVIDKD
ncbi:MAG: hypothetical protein ACM3NR_00390 [Methanosarcina sp.]